MAAGAGGGAGAGRGRPRARAMVGGATKCYHCGKTAYAAVRPAAPRPAAPRPAPPRPAGPGRACVAAAGGVGGNICAGGLLRGGP